MVIMGVAMMALPLSTGTFSLALVAVAMSFGNGIGAGIRKDETELKTKLDEALTALKADGTVDELIAQWFEGRGPYFAE